MREREVKQREERIRKKKKEWKKSKRTTINWLVSEGQPNKSPGENNARKGNRRHGLWY